MYLPTLFSISLTIQCCYWSLTLATLNRGMRKTLHGVALAQADCEIHCGDLLKDCQKMASNIHTRHLCSDYNHHCHQYCKDISHNITQQAITDASSVLPSNLLQCYTTCGQGLTQCSILAADSHEHKKCSINYYQCITPMCKRIPKVWRACQQLTWPHPLHLHILSLWTCMYESQHYATCPYRPIPWSHFCCCGMWWQLLETSFKLWKIFFSQFCCSPVWTNVSSMYAWLW